MSADAPPSGEASRSRKRPALRPLFIAAVLCIAAFVGLLFWPSNPESSPHDLSRADGRSRFYATTYPKIEAPPNLSLPERLSWEWRQYQRRHGDRKSTRL